MLLIRIILICELRNQQKFKLKKIALINIFKYLRNEVIIMTRLIKINVVDRTNLNVSPIKKLLSKFLSQMQLEPVYGPQVYTLRGLNFKLHVTKFQPNLIIVNVDQIVAGEDLPVEKLKQECKDTLIVGLSTMKSKNEIKKLGYDGYLHTIFNAQELQRVFDENGVDLDKLPSADEPIDIPHVDVKKHEKHEQQVEQNQTEQETQESVQDDTKNDLDNTSVDDSSNVTDSVKPVEQEAPQPESKPKPANDVQDNAQNTEPLQSEQQPDTDVKPVETVKEAENTETVNSDKTSNNDSDAQNKSSVQPVQEKQDVQDSDNAPVDNKLQEQQPEPAQSEDDGEGDDAEIDDLMPDMEDLGAEVGLDDSDDSDNDSNDDTANSTIDGTQTVQPESAEDSNKQQDNSQAVQDNQSEQQNTQVDVQNVNNDLNSQPQAEQTAQADRGADNNEHNSNNSENGQNNPAQPKPVQDTSVDQLNNVLNGGNGSGNADPVMAPTESGPKTPNLGGSDEPKKKKKVITDNWQQTHMSNINVKPQTESDSDDDLKNFTAMLKGKIPTAEDDVMNQANQQGTIN